jgi:RsiW-degrading membrane proteinase PrsW (M82 family)
MAKGLPYGAVIFLIVAFITHAITSPNWDEGNKIILHSIPLVFAVAFGFATCAMFGYYIQTSIDSELESILKAILLYPFGMGLLTFIVCIGGGGFTLMAAPDRVLVAFYHGAFTMAMIVVSATLAVSLFRLTRKNRRHPI